MSHKIHWRWMEERDRAAADTMHAELERRIGQAMDRPDLMKRPVIAAVVGEVNGEVKHGLYCEAEIEVCSMSPAVLSAAQMQEAVAMLLGVTQAYDIRIARCYVPTVMVETRLMERKAAIQRTLERLGFTQEAGNVTQFYRWLPEKDKET